MNGVLNRSRIVGVAGVFRCRAALPAEHPHIATAAGDLAWLLQMQGNFVEAEPLYREALQIRAACFGEQGAPTIRTVELLANMPDETHRPADAAALRATTQPAR